MTGSLTMTINLVDAFMVRMRRGTDSVTKYAGLFSIVTSSGSE